MKLNITNEYIGIRLDKVISTLLPDKTRNNILKLIEDGYILVNGKTIKPSQKAALNDVIEIEQQILSGVDSNTNIIESKDLLKNFEKLKGELENNNQRNDILRILSIMMTSLEN